MEHGMNERNHDPGTPLKRVEPNGVEPEFSEDDLQRQQFGPRGVPGQPDPATMTPQRAKKTPANADPGGHTA
jgi:hypothetical protein